MAIHFFESVFKMKEISILDQNDFEKEVSTREMRAYYVKSEAEYQALAYTKYTEELDTKNS